MWRRRARRIGSSHLIFLIKYRWGRGRSKPLLFKSVAMLITRFEIQGRGRREGRARWESAGERACRAVPKRLRGRRKEAMLWRTLRRARGFCKITRARSDGGAKNRVCNSLVVHWATAILEQLTKGQQEIVVAPATDPSRATAMIKPRSCKCFLAKK